MISSFSSCLTCLVLHCALHLQPGNLFWQSAEHRQNFSQKLFSWMQGQVGSQAWGRESAEEEGGE